MTLNHLNVSLIKQLETKLYTKSTISGKFFKIAFSKKGSTKKNRGSRISSILCQANIAKATPPTRAPVNGRLGSQPRDGDVDIFPGTVSSITV